MKILFALAILLCICQQSVAQINPLTLAFVEKPENESVFILSSNNICYGPQSPIRAEQSISISAAGSLNNVFANQQSCEAAGGTLSEEERQIKLISLTVLATKATTKEQLARESTLIQRTIDSMEQKQTAVQEAQEKAEQETTLAMQQAVETEKQRKFFGINFGLGLAFVQMDEPLITDISFNKLTNDENAQNVIFVNHQAKTKAVAMLESHYFFKNSLIDEDPSMEWGHGPFFAISLISEESIDLLTNFGGGWMWGVRREDGSSFNIGLGLYVDTKATLLRPEYQDGMTTAFSDEKLLTYQRDKKGWMLMFSATF